MVIHRELGIQQFFPQGACDFTARLTSHPMVSRLKASFINVFAHNYDELWTDGQSALPKPPGNEVGRSACGLTAQVLGSEVCGSAISSH